MDRSATVLIRHKSDDAALEMVKILESCVDSGLTTPFIDLEVALALEDISTVQDFTCRSVVPGDRGEDTLLNSIARIPDLGILRLAVVNAAEDDAETATILPAIVMRLRGWLDQLQGHAVEIVEVRVGLRAFGEELPNREFYSVTVNANVLAIPQDRISDGGIARPIGRQGETSKGSEFAAHCAVEVASLIGLWTCMGNSPVDEIRPMLAGSTEPRILFSQSRVRALSCPGLPMSEVAPSDEDLPKPEGYFSVVDSRFASEQLAKRVYPSHLVFNADPEPDFFSYDSNLRRLIPAFLREMGRTILGIPRISLRGVKDELHSIAGQSLQQAMGSDSWLQILWAGRDGEGSVEPDFASQLNRVVDAIELQYRRELLSPLSAGDWSDIVQSTLSGIDGNPDWAPLRSELFSNEKMLLLKRADVCAAPSGFSETVSSMANELKIDHRLTYVDGEQPVEPPTNSAETPGIEEIDSEALESEDVESSQVEDEVTQTLSPARRGLLELIGSRFRRESQAAHDHVALMMHRIRTLYGELEVRDTSNVSPIFNVMMSIAFYALFFVVSTCTGFRHVMSFERVAPVTRDSLWTGFSASYLIAAILMLGLGGKRSWQARAAISSLIVSVFVALLVVFFGDLRDSLSTSNGKPYPAIALGTATVVLIAIALVRSFASESALRRRLGRALFAAASLYLLVGLSTWQARKDSWIGGSSQDLRSRLYWVVLIVAVLVIVSSLVFVSIVVMREKNRLNSLAKKIEWARHELVTSVDAERRLSAAAMQWIATGSVLAWLLTYPLGKPEAPKKESVQSPALEGGVLKFDLAQLELSELGNSLFLASLKKNFVEPKWITGQYEKLVRQYQIRLAARTSSKLEDVRESRPECDPEVISLEEMLDGTCSAERFRFAEMVYSGMFDAALVELPQDFDLNKIYEPIINDGTSYNLVGVDADSSSIADFLGQVWPKITPKLPVGLVTRTFTANAPEQAMETSIWWPREVLGEAGGQASGYKVFDSAIRSTRKVSDDVDLVAVRIDISRPFLFTECAHRPMADDSGDARIDSVPHGLTNL